MQRIDQGSGVDDVFVLVFKAQVKVVAVGDAGVRPIAGIETGGCAATALSPLRRLLTASQARRLLLSVRSGVDYASVTSPVHRVLESVANKKGVPLVWLPDIVELVASVSETKSNSKKSSPPWWRLRGGRRPRL